jgi:hypothetical protein
VTIATAKDLQDIGNPERVERRVRDQMARDVESPDWIASMVRSTEQLLRGEGRNWRDIYPADDAS